MRRVSNPFVYFSAVVCALAIAVLVNTSPVQAQSFFEFWSGPSPSKVGASKRAKTSNKSSNKKRSGGGGGGGVDSEADMMRSEKKPNRTGVIAEGPVSHPLVLMVSLKKQRVTVYDGDEIVAFAPISSGAVGRATPMGIYTILEKNRIHHSNLYSSAPMPNMQRITWSGIALHAGVLPGYPASHGCIRMPYSFSKRLFDLTKTGQRVIVARDDHAPKFFEHPTLFKAAPTEALATAKVADASNMTVATSSTGTGLVGTAVAATPTITGSTSPPVSKYRLEWLAEMQKRAKAVVDTAAELDAAKINFAEQTRATSKARDVARAARAESQKLAQVSKRAEADRIAAEKTLDQFAQGMLKENPLTDDGVANAALKEESLDEAVTKKTAAAVGANEDASDASKAVQVASAEEDKAEAALKDAKERLSKAEVEVRNAKASDDAAKRREAKRKYPVSVFVSRQAQKLYVRQGVEPIFEVPVTVTDPNKTIGTHVFTAVAVHDNQTDMKWTAVTIPSPAKTDKLDRKLKKGEEPPPAPAHFSEQTAEAALARVQIPQDARDQITDVMKSGSSFIISDYNVSNETGLFTDIIVPLR